MGCSAVAPDLPRDCNTPHRSSLGTGVAGEHEVGDFFFRALGHGDRFVDVNKMIGSRVVRELTGHLGPGDDRSEEIAPLGVAQQVLKVARQPEFDPPLRSATDHNGHKKRPEPL